MLAVIVWFKLDAKLHKLRIRYVQATNVFHNVMLKHLA